MKRFSINLASRPFRNNTLHWTGLALVVVLLSAFTWYNAATYMAAEGDLERWMDALMEHREAIAEMDRDIARMKGDIGGLDLVAFSKRSDFANEIILSRLFSWTSLFDRLELVMPPKVRLRSIRPSLGKEMIEITIDGMTPEHSALLDFEEALIDSEYFTFVYPVQESTKVKQGEINFSVTFGYLPEGGDSAAVPVPFADALVDEASAPVEPPSPESVPAEAVAQEAAPQASEPPPAAPPEARSPRGKAAPSQAVPARPEQAEGPQAVPPGRPGRKAKGKAPGPRPVRPARAKRPPSPPPDLHDESVSQDPNEMDPNDEDPNDVDPNEDDPNDVLDPNEDDEGGRS